MVGMTASTEPTSPALRRLSKLAAQDPQASPQDLLDKLAASFVRDFALVGGAQAGVQEFTPNLLGTVTRNPKVASITQAASHLGAIQGTASYQQAANQGIAKTAQVSSALSIKNYLQAVALVYGLEAQDGDRAAQQILGQEVSQLLAALEAGQLADQAPSAGKTQQMNILGAITALGVRNPKTMLLVKAGEQLAKAGGAVLNQQKARRAFAQQLVEQVRLNLGEPPAQLPQATSNLLAQLEAEAPEAVQEESVEASELEAPQPVSASQIQEPQEVRASSAQELEEAQGAAAQGARMAARAIFKARSRWGR